MLIPRLPDLLLDCLRNLSRSEGDVSNALALAYRAYLYAENSATGYQVLVVELLGSACWRILESPAG